MRNARCEDAQGWIALTLIVGASLLACAQECRFAPDGRRLAANASAAARSENARDRRDACLLIDGASLAALEANFSNGRRARDRGFRRASVENDSTRAGSHSRSCFKTASTRAASERVGLLLRLRLNFMTPRSESRRLFLILSVLLN